MHVLVLPPPYLREVVARPLEAHLLPITRFVTGADEYWLACDPHTRLPLRSHLLLISEDDPVNAPRGRWSSLPPDAAGVVAIETGRLGRGLWAGRREGGHLVAFDQIVLPGPTMPQIVSAEAFEERARHHPSERLSRTVGALGGPETWRRLVSLSVVVIGCGRSGSLIAHSLWRLGLRHVTLVDPDVVEEHNLGEMDLLSDAHLALPKAQALGELLGFPHVVASGVSQAALDACKAAEVIFCAVDNDRARLAVGLTATLYHKVLVDVGTGIQLAGGMDAPAWPPPQRTMGADVRLVLPGDGCLLCVGGLARLAPALADLQGGRISPPQVDWRTQRAGSLRTLNQIAAHLGVETLQDLVAGRVVRSSWAQVTFDDSGRMAVAYPEVTVGWVAREQCPLCPWAGRGYAWAASAMLPAG